VDARDGGPSQGIVSRARRCEPPDWGVLGARR
jgi:hypothetical protein